MWGEIRGLESDLLRFNGCLIPADGDENPQPTKRSNRVKYGSYACFMPLLIGFYFENKGATYLTKIRREHHGISYYGEPDTPRLLARLLRTVLQKNRQ